MAFRLSALQIAAIAMLALMIFGPITAIGWFMVGRRWFWLFPVSMLALSIIGVALQTTRENLGERRVWRLREGFDGFLTAFLILAIPLGLGFLVEQGGAPLFCALSIAAALLYKLFHWSERKTREEKAERERAEAVAIKDRLAANPKK